jgi:hypothetical protein
MASATAGQQPLQHQHRARGPGHGDTAPRLGQQRNDRLGDADGQPSSGLSQCSIDKYSRTNCLSPARPGEYVLLVFMMFSSSLVIDGARRGSKLVCAARD